MNPTMIQNLLNQFAGEDGGIDINQIMQMLNQQNASGDGTGSFVQPGSDGEGGVEPFEVGKAGKIGMGMHGAAVLGDAMSLATAGQRQKETVDAYKDLAELAGESTEVDPSATNLATLNARGDSEDRQSTLKELLDSGVDPSRASEIIANQKKSDDVALTNQLNQYSSQKQTADEAARSRRDRYDAIATQSGLPIDYWGEGADIARTAGDTALGMESILNPNPNATTTSARAGRKLKYAEGGSLPTTQGASDHSENEMMITNQDGSPAQDQDGNTIAVTGKETIVPDWLMDMLMEAYNKSPEEFHKVFRDEVVEEERFKES